MTKGCLYAGCGESIPMNTSGIPEQESRKGYVFCPLVEPLRAVSKFKAQLQILELREERPVLTAGYKAVIHCHVSIEECEIFKFYESTDPKKKTSKQQTKIYKFCAGRLGSCVLDCFGTTNCC